jgi:hypothetical protein
VHPYVEWLKTASLEDLERPATAAVQAAVKRAHAAGHSTVGIDEAGRLVRCFPNGDEQPLSTDELGS